MRNPRSSAYVLTELCPCRASPRWMVGRLLDGLRPGGHDRSEGWRSGWSSKHVAEILRYVRPVYVHAAAPRVEIQRPAGELRPGCPHRGFSLPDRRYPGPGRLSWAPAQPCPSSPGQLSNCRSMATARPAVRRDRCTSRQPHDGRPSSDRIPDTAPALSHGPKSKGPRRGDSFETAARLAGALRATSSPGSAVPAPHLTTARRCTTSNVPRPRQVPHGAGNVNYYPTAREAEGHWLENSGAGPRRSFLQPRWREPVGSDPGQLPPGLRLFRRCGRRGRRCARRLDTAVTKADRRLRAGPRMSPRARCLLSYPGGTTGLA